MKHWTTYKKKALEYVKKKTRKGWVLQYEPIFFDSETSKKTHLETDPNGEQVEIVDDCWVYIWACSVGNELFYGRCLHEFFDFLRLLIKELDICETKRIDIQVHNLSYDISYMWDLIFKLQKEFDGESHSLFSGTRKIITHDTGIGISFKCTYRMSGRSLDKWCKDLGVEHKKLVGAIDYQETHTPYDKLDHDQYKYLAYDVLTLKDCYYKEVALQGYKFSNCPLTMTGFVRKMFQKAYRTKGEYFNNQKLFHETELNQKQYERCLKASAGGMTASSIRYISTTIFHPFGIGHVDFKSHYPTQQRINPFPMRPMTIKEPGDGRKLTFKDLKWYRDKFNYYYIVELELKNIRLKKGVTAPFLFSAKCCKDLDSNMIHCNGKVVRVDGIVKVCMTNFDLAIIIDQYEIESYNILACDMYSTRKLPGYIINTIDSLYAAKSDLKHKCKADPYNSDLAATYAMKKSQLNSVFGCTYTRPVRPDIQIDENFNYHIDYNHETLEDFYNNKNSCLSYQHGVFTTSLARFELFTVIRDVIGYDAFLYCDTDSAFYLDSPSIKMRIDEYNDNCRQDAIDNDYYVTLEDGTKEYYHNLDYESDSSKAKYFRALHAKCYALKYSDGHMSITIAGVPKKNKDGFTREDELQSIDNMVSGFTFEKCGGTRADYTTIREYQGYSGGGCAILETKKTIHEVLFNEGEYTLHSN